MNSNNQSSPDAQAGKTKKNQVSSPAENATTSRAPRAEATARPGKILVDAFTRKDGVIMVLLNLSNGDKASAQSATGEVEPVAKKSTLCRATRHQKRREKRDKIIALFQRKSMEENIPLKDVEVERAEIAQEIQRKESQTRKTCNTFVTKGYLVETEGSYGDTYIYKLGEKGLALVARSKNFKNTPEEVSLKPKRSTESLKPGAGTLGKLPQTFKADKSKPEVSNVLKLETGKPSKNSNPAKNKSSQPAKPGRMPARIINMFVLSRLLEVDENTFVAIFRMAKGEFSKLAEKLQLAFSGHGYLDTGELKLALVLLRWRFGFTHELLSVFSGLSKSECCKHERAFTKFLANKLETVPAWQTIHDAYGLIKCFPKAGEAVVQGMEAYLRFRAHLSGGGLSQKRERSRKS